MKLDEFQTLATRYAFVLHGFHPGSVSQTSDGVIYEAQDLNVSIFFVLRMDSGVARPHASIGSAPAVIGDLVKAQFFHQKMAYLCALALEFNRDHGSEAVIL